MADEDNSDWFFDYIDDQLFETIEFVIKMFEKAELDEKIADSWVHGSPFSLCMGLLHKLHEHKNLQRIEQFVSLT